MAKEFSGFNHGMGKIVLKFGEQTGLTVDQKRPVQVHLKEDGAIGDKPSVAIVMTNGKQVTVGEISLEMWNEGLKDIGYQIVKTDTK